MSEFNPEVESLTEYLSRIWGGRKFKCGITGEELTMPDIIYRGEFFSFGESFIDIGNEYYCRTGGNPIEIKE